MPRFSTQWDPPSPDCYLSPYQHSPVFTPIPIVDNVALCDNNPCMSTQLFYSIFFSLCIHQKISVPGSIHPLDALSLLGLLKMLPKTKQTFRQQICANYQELDYQCNMVVFLWSLGHFYLLLSKGKF